MNTITSKAKVVWVSSKEKLEIRQLSPSLFQLFGRDFGIIGHYDTLVKAIAYAMDEFVL